MDFFGYTQPYWYNDGFPLPPRTKAWSNNGKIIYILLLENYGHPNGLMLI